MSSNKSVRVVFEVHGLENLKKHWEEFVTKAASGCASRSHVQRLLMIQGYEMKGLRPVVQALGRNYESELQKILQEFEHYEILAQNLKRTIDWFSKYKFRAIDSLKSKVSCQRN